MFHRYVQTSDQWAHWSDIPSTMITTDSCITPNILLLSDVSQSILLLNRLTACFSLLAICFIFSLLIDTCSSQDKSWCENQINVSWYIWSNLQFFKMYSHKIFMHFCKCLLYVEQRKNMGFSVWTTKLLPACQVTLLADQLWDKFTLHHSNSERTNA